MMLSFMIVVMVRFWKEMDYFGVVVEIWWLIMIKSFVVLERGLIKEIKFVVEVNKNKFFDKLN